MAMKNSLHQYPIDDIELTKLFFKGEGYMEDDKYTINYNIHGKSLENNKTVNNAVRIIISNDDNLLSLFDRAQKIFPNKGAQQKKANDNEE